MEFTKNIKEICISETKYLKLRKKKTLKNWRLKRSEQIDKKSMVITNSK